MATKSPEGLQATSVGAYCFPMIIDSSAVDTFSWEVNGVENYTADLTKPAPAI
ncbi:MAG: hypothetical protein JKY56_16315 [Kofleriaceae bacterium]|nr:hypothetical protein [Kofleriaceae bacterium]